MIRNLKSAIQNPKSLGDSAQCAGAGGQGHQIILDFRFSILDWELSQQAEF
jgi:hypothetical protein